MSSNYGTSSEDSYERRAFIQTFPSGSKFWIDQPVFVVEDIAHSLGMNCRFNGNVRHFQSVAEHSIVVSLLMEKYTGGDPFEGLMHDATEAYMTDMAKPWKHRLPDWSKIDHYLETQLRVRFNMPPAKTPECSHADWLSLFIEAWFLVPDRGECFTDPLGLREEALSLIDDEGWGCVGLPPQEATAAFLRRYHELRPAS